MIPYKKCCAQCPGVIDVPECEKTHECCLPKYVSGLENADQKLKCYDRFAIAKKLHAENLKHQPLPDKVNDDIMKNFKLKESFHLPSLNEQYRNNKKDNSCNKLGSKYHCDAVLGYKKPETKMDLAICWQTPVDPIYEPPRSTHIDGSEGGAAPAIFELVQGAPRSRCDQLRSNNYNVKHNNNKNREIYEMNFAKKDQDKRYNNSHQNQNNCKHHCKCMDSMNIQKSISRERSRSQCSIRNSAVICENKEKNDPRLIKSAVGITLGTESNNASRRLPQKIDVPRPKTPFAKRSFSIETLSPPFSIVNGCRDTDYPEHWRLMTVYQQSYKNPRKYKANFHR
ncbi:uncharacterized protein LOC118446351 isoform X1 [Vespa mandarinia]|uniref:uncharacterized protein LOC118446351 isoform X1 n=1 Tax=Vespa mandarinia TaxID=7446 RepID=UPI001608C633|nr:uncharacterized protein LOC118446351 isoform X1 [Vespa mandarinia]